MSHHQGRIAPQFFVTAPQPCPYLDGRAERKLFTTLRNPDASSVNDMLSLRGFRRSQGVVYRPSCPGCAACLSTRIPVEAFRPSRTQKRIAKRNADLSRAALPPEATEEQYRLFRRYLDARHADGGMAEMDVFEFAAMVEETPVRTRMVEYRMPDPDGGAPELVGACVTDVLKDGLSMVYSFFEPTLAARSLGAEARLGPVPAAAVRALDLPALAVCVLEEAALGETVAALQATRAAARATDANLAAVQATIAADETRHAALARDLADWASSELDEAANARIAAASQAAWDRLLQSLHTHEGLPALGLPDQADALALADALRTALHHWGEPASA